MAKALLKRVSERRTEHLLNDLLVSQGWDLRRPPLGNLLLQNEYKNYPDLSEALASASKTGKSFGIPEAILIDPATTLPIAVIEAKPRFEQIEQATVEAQGYADALSSAGDTPLAIAISGNSEDEFVLRVFKKKVRGWEPVTYDGSPISWIPNPSDAARVLNPTGPSEIRPTVPPIEVLAARADEINRLLREARIKDEFRPAVVAAIMLALWHSKGQIRREPQYILRDVNEACRDAFIKAGKADLARSLRVDEANEKLRLKARRIAKILERLNVTVLTAEHDYLGQLYEAFFRYTGGNTIGQYFTPRHIARLMADVCGVTKNDVIIDPACGTGGFLVACMDRILTEHHLSRQQMVDIVSKNLIGYEDEPVTAALCVANMILRGDGSTRVYRADSLTAVSFPQDATTVALLNPPFPHRKTDTPAEAFIERALDSLGTRGKMAAIMPLSLLVKKEKEGWREGLLRKNTLLAVCQLPDELFQPFASATTCFVVMEKGIPHGKNRKTMFARIEEDGYQLKKGTRVETPLAKNQIPLALDAIINGTERPGFSTAVAISGKMEWSPGAYIESKPAEDNESKIAVDTLLRRLASFYTRYAPEILAQRNAIHSGEIEQVDYRVHVSKAKLANSALISGNADEIGSHFDILYGFGEIESRDGIAPGSTLIISPTERYNGCYGWLEFPKVIKPPFITVARTGSIGEAFVHLEPCAPNSDCLILLPKTERFSSIPELLLAASAIRLEKWRYSYGRKITPSRIASVKLNHARDVTSYVDEIWVRFIDVINSSLAPYVQRDHGQTPANAIEAYYDKLDVEAIQTDDDDEIVSWNEI
ncbi:class I SAM-dependent DNA methyltransferase [Agrobacterium sp. OT33]|uniref:HsdM family class I SAM-dependent methyltransferase n=1 Tax=Agrobacterium sp. OT33 TaxID=2815338 RepID=UPI001A8CF145|nr:N-6 DNA methylase [Agrobacterium sp. OT33]MBO0127125.1 N-6 DNA methylase [Agrobacterium sp. OT33]